MLIQLYPTGEVRWQGFDPNVIETIKQIPAKDRQYSPDTKTWTVQPSQHAELARLLAEQGHSVEMPVQPLEAPTGQGQAQAPNRPVAGHTEALVRIERELGEIRKVLTYLYDSLRGGAQR